MNLRAITFVFIVSMILLGCAQPKIEYLCKTESGDKTNEYYLITNLPSDEEEVRKIVEEHSKQSNLYFNIQRVYLKEHNNHWVDLFGDNIDYRKEKCGELDIIDIICTVQRIQTPLVKDTVWYNFHFPIVDSYY